MTNYYYINQDLEVLGTGRKVKKGVYNVQLSTLHDSVYKIAYDDFDAQYRASKSKLLFCIEYSINKEAQIETYFNSCEQLYSQDIIKNGLISGESYRTSGPHDSGPSRKIYSQNSEDITQHILEFLDCTPEELISHKFSSEELFQLETLHGEILLLPEKNTKLQEIITLTDKIYIFMEEYLKKW